MGSALLNEKNTNIEENIKSMDNTILCEIKILHNKTLKQNNHLQPLQTI